MDIGTVGAYAAGFARAMVSDDSELIASYILQELEEDISEVLAMVPRPVEHAEVLTVTTPRFKQCESLTEFSGPCGETLLQAIWTEPHEQLIIQEVRIIDWTALLGFASISQHLHER